MLESPTTEAGASTAPAQASEEVLVLDFGGQYSQLIARRVRECGVFSELLPHHVGAAEVARRKPKGLILSGGPASVYAEGAPRLDPALLELGIPVLGICYGQQLMAHILGGRVEKGDRGEYGFAQLDLLHADGLFNGVVGRQQVWMSHRDAVQDPPPGFEVLGSTSTCTVAAMASPERGLYAVHTCE